MPKLLYHPKVAKQIKSLHSLDQKKIKRALEKISQEKTKQNIKKLTNTKNSYRLRVGDIRIIFEKENKTIFIRKIGYRGQIY